MIQTRTFLRTSALAACLLACALPANYALALGWGGEHVEGNGHITKQSRELGHFNALATSVGGNIEVRIGDTESVTIETDDNLQALIETVIENGTLRIRPQKKDQQLDTRTLRIVVQSKGLERIAVGGSGSVDAAHLRGHKLDFDIGGSGSIEARDLQSDAVSIALGGSGNLKAGGSGKVQAGQLAVHDASVSIGGSGQATVNALQTLSVSVAGSGDVGYYGNPQVSKNVIGSGAVKHLAGAPM